MRFGGGGTFDYAQGDRLGTTAQNLSFLSSRWSPFPFTRFLIEQTGPVHLVDGPSSKRFRTYTKPRRLRGGEQMLILTVPSMLSKMNSMHDLKNLVAATDCGKCPNWSRILLGRGGLACMPISIAFSKSSIFPDHL